jgi:exopolysaccharide biosynthesis protein
MKVRHPLSPILVLLALGAASSTVAPGVASEPPPRQDAWMATADGLEVSMRSAGSAIVVLVRADPERSTLRVIRAANGGVITATDAARQSGATAVINGGFFDDKGQPIGWLVSDDRVITPPGRAGWGAFIVRKGRPAIVGSRPERTAGISQAVQAGPRLVLGGQPNPRLKAQSARRSFIGLDGKGRVILGATGPSEVDARVLAAFLAKPEIEGGAGLVEALNLDGGSSSQLHVRGVGDRNIDFPGIAVPVLIAIEPKAKKP